MFFIVIGIATISLGWLSVVLADEPFRMLFWGLGVIFTGLAILIYGLVYEASEYKKEVTVECTKLKGKYTEEGICLVNDKPVRWNDGGWVK